MDRPGTGRRALRSNSGCDGDALLPDLPDDGQFLVHERVRAAFLDGMCGHFAGLAADWQGSSVALVRTRRRNRNPEQAFHAALRVRVLPVACRDAAARAVAVALDLARRAD